MVADRLTSKNLWRFFLAAGGMTLLLVVVVVVVGVNVVVVVVVAVAVAVAVVVGVGVVVVVVVALVVVVVVVLVVVVLIDVSFGFVGNAILRIYIYALGVWLGITKEYSEKPIDKRKNEENLRSQGVFLLTHSQMFQCLPKVSCDLLRLVVT